MTRTATIKTTAGALCLAAALLVPGIARAAASSAAQSSSTSVLRYWTSQRMESARPADAGTDGFGHPSHGIAGRRMPVHGAGKLRSIAPRLAANDAVLSPLEALLPRSAQATKAYPYPFTRDLWHGPADDLVRATEGKVFFTKSDGRPYVCSATAISSANESVVWTAGHCVNTGGRGSTFHTNWMFVPAYDHGDAPYGKWAARMLYTTQQWASSASFRYDFGAVVVAPLPTGETLNYVVGGQGITFNASANQRFLELGYPQAAPFDGQSLYYCDTTAAVLSSPDRVYGPQTIGVGCDMTGGASGGGWLIGFDGVGGYVDSVNSYKIVAPVSLAQPLAMYGPYQGDVAAGLFDAAQNYR
jgi:V8-like Glu-specific endopeptidase